MKLLNIYIVISILIALNQYLPAKIIYVNNSFSGSIPDGTALNPYYTITEAINKASESDTISIAAGDYDDGEASPIVIRKCLTILGEDKSNTVLNRIIVDKCGMAGKSMTISGLNFLSYKFIEDTIDNFGEKKIINCSFGDVVVAGSMGHSFLILGCDIGGVTTLSKGSAPASYIIESCTINKDIKTNLKPGQTLILSNNVISNNVITDNSEDCFFEVYDNKFINSRIEISGASNKKYSSYFIRNNDITIGRSNVAIYMSGKSAYIENNIINCKERASGIYIPLGDSCKINNNVINLTQNSTYGIFALSKLGEITGNTIQGGIYGIYNQFKVSKCNSNIISESETGISAGNYIELTDNTIRSCTGNAVEISGAEGFMAENIIENNLGNGVIIKRGNAEWSKTPFDLGGGYYDSPGNNKIINNGKFDLMIESTIFDTTTIFAKNNIWDHDNFNDIDVYDIWDGNDDDSIPITNFTPFKINSSIQQLTTNDYQPSTVIVYPNPLSGSATISYEMKSDGNVQISIYDYMGNKIESLINEYQYTGKHKFNYIAGELQTGLYYLKFEAGNEASQAAFIKINK